MGIPNRAKYGLVLSIFATFVLVVAVLPTQGARLSQPGVSLLYIPVVLAPPAAPEPTATLEPTATATSEPTPTATLESTPTSEPTATATLEPTPTATNEPSPTATEVPPAPTPTATATGVVFVFSGTSDQVSQPFALARGLYIVDSVHSGRSNFIVHLLDTTGNTVEFLVNEIGNVTSSTTMFIPAQENFLLEVQADGAWEVKVRVTSPAEINGGPRVPTTVSGVGDKTLFVTFGQGLARFHLTHTGSRNFIVHLNDLENNTFGFLANKIGNADVTAVEQIDQAGAYILDIQADGAWSIDITQ